MEQHSKENLARWIESLAKTVSEDSQANLARVGDKIYLASPGDKDAPDLRKLSDALLEEGGWDGKLSGDYVEQGVLGILLELKECPTDEILPLLDQLMESFDAYDEPRTVYIALSGVKMTDVDELRVGEAVLKKMTDAQKEELAERFDTEDDKKRFFDRIRVVPFAEMRISAEPIKAWEIALERLPDVLDALRYAMPFLSEEDLDPDINLLGHEVSSPPLVAVHNGEVEDLFGSLRDLPTSLEISSKAVREMEDAGVFEVAKLARKMDKTRLERKVLRGIKWASDSQAQREPDNKLLSLIIALECLLPSPDQAAQGLGHPKAQPCCWDETSAPGRP